MPKDPIAIEFAKMIRKWRTRRKQGLREFAVKIGISATVLSKLESEFTEEESKESFKRFAEKYKSRIPPKT